MGASRELRATVVSSPATGEARLEWRVLLSERTRVFRGSDFEDFDPDADEDWAEEVTIPEYGDVVASTVRPYAEFHEAMESMSLTEYVSRHLPRPQ